MRAGRLLHAGATADSAAINATAPSRLMWPAEVGSPRVPGARTDYRMGAVGVAARPNAPAEPAPLTPPTTAMDPAAVPSAAALVPANAPPETAGATMAGRICAWATES